MRTLSAWALMVFLGLSAPVGAQVQKQNAGANPNQIPNAANMQTIHGVVTGVTIAGETIINYETDQAMVARTTYLTVLGAPGKGHEKGDAQRNENAKDDDKDSQHKKHWNHVYYLAITPQTKVCMEGEDSKKNGSTPADQQKRNEAFQKIELGEHVRVEFTPFGPPGNRPADMKHGRERTLRGQASSIEICKEDTRSDQNSKENRSNKDKK